MSIKVTIKNVYGNPTIYPECAHAHGLCTLTRRRTFTPSDIERLKALGYEIRVVNDDPWTL